MKKFRKIIFLFVILILLGGCKASNKKVNETKNSVEINVSCGQDSELQEYLNEGWTITKEYSEEKICSWKSVPASKNCNMEKDKGCKIMQPDKIGEEKIYLLTQ
tara:strand:- start:117 stop:428 length:312 start_codon:yes stop_codon:yes gene_type:complete